MAAKKRGRKTKKRARKGAARASTALRAGAIVTRKLSPATLKKHGLKLKAVGTRNGKKAYKLTKSGRKPASAKKVAGSGSRKSAGRRGWDLGGQSSRGWEINYVPKDGGATSRFASSEPEYKSARASFKRHHPQTRIVQYRPIGESMWYGGDADVVESEKEDLRMMGRWSPEELRRRQRIADKEIEAVEEVLARNRGV